MRAERQDARMGHSLPIPLDVQPGASTGHEHTGASHVTTMPRPDEAAAQPDANALPGAPEAASGSPDAFTAAIVRAKVRTPGVRPNTLERPRLLGWLDDHAHQRVRILVAEAGYGKSTLIADHAKRTGRRAAWYRLDGNDVAWVAMLSYIVASIREVIPGFGISAVNLLQRVGVLNATRDMVLDTVLAEMDALITEPLTLILDDFHVVQDDEDVRAIVSRLIEFAPPTVDFIIAGRRHPGSLLARWKSQGQVAELGTQELRFTKPETAHLIGGMLGAPLDEDLVDKVDERLAGWGASLLLVGTSLIGLRPRDVRTLIEELTSRSEPLYDYLAEQVLGRQPPVMRRVLSVAAILERIEPTLVMAALVKDAHLSRRRVEAVLAQAEDTGVLSRTATSGRWWRFHPLVRDFMLSRLLENTGRPTLLEMHLRVARAAEPIDWAASAHHYIEAEHRADAMRVLRESAIEALGTASWGAATALADRMPDQPVPEAVMVIKAYDMAARGQAAKAVVLLEGLAPDPSDAMAWGLTRAALANLYLITGNVEGVRGTLAAMADHPDLVPVLVSLARGTAVLLATHEGGPLAEASEVLEGLAQQHTRLGLTYFAGVSYHNAALAALARGRYEKCVTLGQQAIEQFNRTASRHGVESTHAVVALGLAELGRFSRASEHLEQVPSGEQTLADAQADAAWIASAQGDTNSAWILVERATASTLDGARTPGAHAAVQYSRALVHLVEGDLVVAERVLAAAREGSLELDAAIRHSAMRALVGLLAGEPAVASQAAAEGLEQAEDQGATHWVRWLRLLASVAASDAEAFRRALANLVAAAKLSSLVLADAIALGLGLIGGAPDELVDLMRAWPDRWLPVLRRVVQSSNRDAAMVAAKLLAVHGTVDDVVLLTAFERKHIRQPARRTLSRKLARHANPTLVIHDLGRLRIQVGQRVVPLSQSRRKAAFLLAFLASRPSHSATRDQVLEAMWPNQSPEGAANSLHQTLFFLRRDIDPWFEDGHSVDYLVVEPDVVFLDPELVLVDSAAFFRQVSAALASADVAELGVPILRDYQAKFALDFEYEDWSTAWRDQLHGLYLETAQATTDALMAQGQHQAAVDVIERVLAIDPMALDLEASLVVALHLAGATAAAAHQYRHYAKAYEEELGEQARSLSSLLEAARATGR